MNEWTQTGHAYTRAPRNIYSLEFKAKTASIIIIIGYLFLLLYFRSLYIFTILGIPIHLQR